MLGLPETLLGCASLLQMHTPSERGHIPSIKSKDGKVAMWYW